MTQKRSLMSHSPMARGCSHQPRNRTSEFASASKRQSMTIIDRLITACATGLNLSLRLQGHLIAHAVMP